MKTDMKPIMSFFSSIGASELIHTGDKNYTGHLVAVKNDLRKWGCEEDVCLAGLFHSIYGTERFQRFTLPLERREEIRDLIGERAEQLAYWNCAMDRPSFDQSVQSGESTSFKDRITGEIVNLSERDFTDLMTLHLCDWLEQVPRSKEWSYRRDAYRQMAERLGGNALAAYDGVYAQEQMSV